MSVYTQKFYQNRHQRTAYAARTIVSYLLERLPPVRSAIDLGCGVGTWLSALKAKGVNDIQGVDGNWVDQNLLQVPRESFLIADLTKPFVSPRRYDLAVSLEVAEHLPSRSARDFVSSLTRLSDFVLFSAAIPFQGGKNHINEQWHDYWGELFLDQGHVALDIIRKAIWHDKNIPAWYRQNIILFVKRERISDVRRTSDDATGQPWPLSLVHPEIFLSRMERQQSVEGSWDLFRRAVRNWIRQRMKRDSQHGATAW